MKQITAIVCGCGSRGRTYSKYSLEYPEAFRLVGIAEPLVNRRESFRTTFNVPEENIYNDWREILSREKFADICIISMQDRLHYEAALAAIDKGYDLLLEKPMAPTPEECMEITRAAEKKGVRVLVCHVLRFTPFFGAIKKLLDDGVIGDIVNIDHVEAVGNIHQSHSYVRGNWHNEAASANMLLAKSCHDIDILQWLVGKQFKRIHSFGSLKYFCAKNRPEGAPDRCIEGCPHGETCIYNAVKLYYDDKKNGWFRRAATMEPGNAPDELVEKAMWETDYGRCIFAVDNDVVDHQVVNIEFEDEILVTFTMSAFNKGGRSIRIMGTKGELSGMMKDGKVTVYDFATKEYTEYDSNTVAEESILGGHGGGDTGIMNALIDLFANGHERNSVAPVRTAAINHLAVFAAEESRHTGTVVDFDEYVKKYL